jgi:hypothetical protein
MGKIIKNSRTAMGRDTLYNCILLIEVATAGNVLPNKRPAMIQTMIHIVRYFSKNPNFFSSDIYLHQISGYVLFQ